MKVTIDNLKVTNVNISSDFLQIDYEIENKFPEPLLLFECLYQGILLPEEYRKNHTEYDCGSVRWRSDLAMCVQLSDQSLLLFKGGLPTDGDPPILPRNTQGLLVPAGETFRGRIYLTVPVEEWESLQTALDEGQPSATSTLRIRVEGSPVGTLRWCRPDRYSNSHMAQTMPRLRNYFDATIQLEKPLPVLRRDDFFRHWNCLFELPPP